MEQKQFEKLFEEAKEFFKKEGFVIADKKLKAILAAIEIRKPILVVGATGCGKTDFIMKLAKFLKGDYEYASLNGSITIHDLTQERVLAKDGTFEERDMVLARWLRSAAKGTSILQLDEVNAAKPETLLAMHPIMDIKGELRLPYTNEVLKVNKNCILIMSCNEGDEYSGVNAMNMAFQNRYVKIHFDYISGKELMNMLVNKTNVPIEKVKQVVDCWTNYMSARTPEQPIVSIRVLETWLEMSKLIGLKTAGEFTFASLIAKDSDELAQIIEGTFFVHITER